jgi:hypothetical protein
VLRGTSTCRSPVSGRRGAGPGQCVGPARAGPGRAGGAARDLGLRRLRDGRRPPLGVPQPDRARLLGRPFAELQGQDYLLSFPEHERSYLLALEHDQRAGDTGFYANTVVRPDGSEVGITWSGSVLHANGQELAPAIFHPTFG